MTYETVWGGANADAMSEIRAFSESNGVSIPDAAASGAVCFVRDDEGLVRGFSWVQADDIPVVAGRRFWVYRSVVEGPPGEVTDTLLTRTFVTLDDDFDRDAGGPIGLCLTVTDVAEMERRPAARWEEPPMLFAGYAPDGSQIRVAYFHGAQI